MSGACTQVARVLELRCCPEAVESNCTQKCKRMVGGDRRPHADMSSNMLYSVLLRYMSDPQLCVTSCHISVSPGNPQGQQDHTVYL
jgi:hypothetical protein